MIARAAAALALVAAGPVVSAAQSGPPAAPSDRPAVHVLATGGTIASTRGPGPLTGETLVEAVPELDAVASITVEQFSNIGSSRMTPAHWRALALRIDELFRTRPELTGVVITHGTDTMEETAYFLHLTVRSGKPVVVTGAMRPADAVGADGPANLHDAVRLAVSPHAVGRGTLVLMNDEIHAARAVTKRHASRTDAFVSPRIGALGEADPDAIVFYRTADRARRDAGEFRLDASADALPRVDIVYSYAGADGRSVRAFVEAGARGLVVATVGRGNVPPAQAAALREAARQGIVVVESTRTGAGRVPVGRAVDDEGRGAPFGAGDLNPQKARVLLMLALTRTDDPEEIAELFRTSEPTVATEPTTG